MFQNGKRQEALPLLAKSAARGEPRSQYIYGTTLFNGDIVAKDWVRAYALMTRASAAGLAPASTSLAQMDQFIPLDQRQKGLALARTMEIDAAKPMMASVAEVPRPVSRPQQTAEPFVRPAPVSRQPEPAPSFEPAVAVPTYDEAQDEPAPAAPPPVRRPAAIGKGWRVQLGAFGDPSKARSLFAGLQSSIPVLSRYQAQLVPAGAVTRLQAGPMASQGEAAQVCAVAKAKGQGCLVVAPSPS
jgi:cell division septation protein DedD